jgi:hypothetical protein
MKAFGLSLILFFLTGCMITPVYETTEITKDVIGVGPR